jgi:hypothetical protein
VNSLLFQCTVAKNGVKELKLSNVVKMAVFWYVAIWKKFTDVSKVIAASIIRAFMMEAASLTASKYM